MNNQRTNCRSNGSKICASSEATSRKMILAASKSSAAISNTMSADIVTDNGVIHVIDKVLMPK